jgi:hypothetical protein
MSAEDEKEDRLTTLAIIEFGFKFAEYVKEMDPDLWKRAVDYAKDWTQVEGVSFYYVNDEDKDEDCSA